MFFVFLPDVQDDWHSGEGDVDVEGKVREMQQITTRHGTRGRYALLPWQQEQGAGL